MSFSSRSSNGKHYRYGHHGRKHYQKKGLLEKVFGIIGSKSLSHNNFGNPYNNRPMYDQPITNPNVMFCKRCNSQIPAGSKFCLECGESVSSVVLCTNCGEKLPPNAKFCSKCGNRINL